MYPRLVVAAGVSLAVLILPLCGKAPARTVSDKQVQKVHRSAVLVDTHNDVTSFTVQGLDIGASQAKRHTDLARLKQGGVGAVFFAVYVDSRYAQANQSAHRALEMIDTVRRDIAGRYSNDFQLALTAGDIVRARKNGRIAVLLGIEGGHAIEDSLRLLRTFYDLGVRYMTLTHMNSNNWAESSGEMEDSVGQRPKGLTDFGREVVREMNRLGMLVDISHVSDKAFRDVLETSSAPVFASHSSCRALSGIARNMSDEMIVALAKKGGVIQINFGCEFLNQEAAGNSPFFNPVLRPKFLEALAPYRDDPERRREEELRLMREWNIPAPKAPLSDVVAHIDHVVKIAGIDAVGLGSDFDGVECTPEGLEDVSKFPNLTRALLERGYSPADIRKILGSNLLRVMRAAERAAGR